MRQALDLLVGFRARLDAMGEGRVPRELQSVVVEFEDLLQSLQLRYGLLQQVLGLTNDLVADKDRDGCYAMV